jgi:transcriptional regulator with XRE-family HTH domain
VAASLEPKKRSGNFKPDLTARRGRRRIKEMPTVVGDRIQREREARGWDQSELAKRAGMSSQRLSAIETGVSRRPRADAVVAVAKALGLPAEELWLLSLSDTPPTESPRPADSRTDQDDRKETATRRRNGQRRGGKPTAKTASGKDLASKR